VFKIFIKIFLFLFIILTVTASPSILYANDEKVLKRGNGAEPDTLDPHLATGAWEGNIINDLFIGLYTKDINGKPVGGSSIEYSKTEDGLKYTFILRENHFWSDGIKVTANDYVSGFRRVLNPKTASQYASLLYMIKNAKEINNGTKPIETLGVRALDDYKLEIELEYPTPYLLELLTHYTTYPIPSHILEIHGKEWIKPKNVQTNGPYKLLSWRAHDSIRLKRNTFFYDDSNVWFDEVIYYPTEDNEAALRRFRAGELDINSGYPENKTSWLKKNMPHNIRHDNILVVTYLIFNCQSEPFTDKLIRRAVSLSIDRDIIVNKIRNFNETIAWSLVPKGILNYEYSGLIEEKNFTQEERYIKAIKILESKGYSKDNPLKFTLKYRNGGDQKKHMVAIQSMLSKANIEVSLEASEPKVLYNYLRTGDFQVGDAGWIADFNDASNFLFLFESSSGPLNYGKYINPNFDLLMKNAQKEIDTIKRASILKNAEEILMEDMPLAPILFGISRSLVKEDISGWKENSSSFHGTRYLKRVTP
jgi:oligopeptide transport system substrate-binding protein